MNRSLIVIFLCLLLLSGCAANRSTDDFEQSVSSGEVPDDPDTPNIPDTSDIPDTPNIPDTSDMPDTPPQTESLSYEEYFSEIRYYPSAGGYGRPPKEAEEGCPVCRPTRSDGFYVDVEGGQVYARKGYNRITDSFQYEWLIAEIANFQVLLADNDWIYGIEDGKTLFRMDWHGANRQDLVTNSELVNGIEEFNAYLADGQVLFFINGNDSSGMLCRLYIPSQTLDVLTTDLPNHAGLGSPISNHEVVWYSNNPEFDALYETLRNDPTSDVSKMDDDGTAQGAVELIGHTSISLIHYYNSLTGEYDKALNDGIYYVNPNPPWWVIW